MLMADMTGGINPEASAAIERPPIAASGAYVGCARLGTKKDGNPAIDVDMGMASSTPNTSLITFEETNTWDGPLSVADLACNGVVSYRSSFELRSRGLSQKVPRSKFVVRVPAQATAEAGSGRKSLRGTIDSQPLCILSRELQGETPPTVRLVRVEERRYKEKGQPRLHTRDVDSLAKLACDSAESSTGGVGPDMGDGTGGVSAK